MTGTVPVEIREESGMKQRRRKTKEEKKSSGPGDGEQVSMDKEMESKCPVTFQLFRRQCLSVVQTTCPHYTSVFLYTLQCLFC